jgi:cytoskeletal protein CcmA (bactofilin family)
MSVSERGLVEGEIRVPNIVLNGSVVGDVYATEHIELAAQARVTGNVYYRLIEMARGAEVNGNFVHVAEGDTFGAKGGVTKALPKRPAAAETAPPAPLAISSTPKAG